MGDYRDPLRKVAHFRDLNEIRRFYDTVYHQDAHGTAQVPGHLRRLAAKLGPWKGQKFLDVGCGTGQWLSAVAGCGASVVGIDLSSTAIGMCKRILLRAELCQAAAEELPFANERFDAVSCLGVLEHVLGPERALHEMVRVAKHMAVLLFLVPNAGFLPRRLGLYRGTFQARVREEVRDLEGWQDLLESSGLRVIALWRDLHVLSWSWIRRGAWYLWPLRAAQAVSLLFWPLSWQYQIYYLCIKPSTDG